MNHLLQPLIRIVLKATKRLHYVGLLFVIGLMIYAHVSTQMSQSVLAESIKQQGTLRNLLWANLITQRAIVTELSGQLSHDESALEKAVSMSHAIRGLMVDMSEHQEQDQELLEDIAQIEKLFDDLQLHGKQNLFSTLLRPAETLTARINEKETQQWYELAEKNKRLLAELKEHKRIAYVTYALFIIYLGFLVWIENRNRKAEQRIREVEAQLSASAKLSSLGEMAGGMAHEMNTPLAIIQMNMEHLQELIDDPTLDRELIKEQVASAIVTVGRIATLIQALRSFTRNGNKEGWREVSVRALVENSLLLCRERVKEAALEVVVEEIGRDLLIKCNIAQISQVLVSLIGNSCDALKGHPTKWIRIQAKEVEDRIRIKITDSGNGIPMSVQAKLFQPFFTTKDVGSGTGLGLSVAKNIIENHGGTLSLDNQARHTCFVVELPREHFVTESSAA